jgi:hypothetical protein
MTKKVLKEVDAILAALIRNWPTLMRTRNDALRWVFTNSGTEWMEDGYPYPDAAYQASTRDLRDEDESAAEDGKCWKGKEKAAQEARGRLRARRENQQITFTCDNADLLAIEAYSEFSYPPSFSTYELNRIPLDKLNDDWKGALVEFCRALLQYSEDDARRHCSNGKSKEYIDRSVLDVKFAHETATECIARLGLGQHKDARAEALNKIREEARKFGFKLEPIDPENTLGY